MGLPNKTRGEFRPIYEALIHGKDFKRLSPDAKHLWMTLKILCGAIGLKVWPALSSSLAELTGVADAKAARAVRELIDSQWIEYEDGIVWIVRGLDFEPQVSHGIKHRQWVRNQLVAFSDVPIIQRFRERYAVFFVEPDPRPSDTVDHNTSTRVPDRVSHGDGVTTAPSPSPSPSLPDGRETQRSDGHRAIASPGTSERLQPDPGELARLRAASLPHEAFALDYFLSTATVPYAIVAELFATGSGSGMHRLRGKATGNPVEIEHVMRAVAEMFANQMEWNVALFRGCARRIADRPPESASPEERSQAKIAAEVQARAALVEPVIGVRNEDGSISNVVLEVDDSPEARERRRVAREVAMAEFRRDAKRADKNDPARTWPARYEQPPDEQAAVA